jgi:ElaB/YqjD/DUF883 family membrane-anchored ribosome-binding protein
MADTPPTAKKPAARKAAPTKKPAAKKPAAKKPAAARTKGTVATKPTGVEARAKFSRALEEARAGASALGHEARERAGEYRDRLSANGSEWADEAKELAGQAKDRAAALAKDGKSKASDAIATLGKLMADNAGTIDDKLGVRYGDYARTAARSMQETAAKIEAKNFDELGDDAKEFVRKSPGLAIGIAAIGGFFLARLFRGSSKD